MKFFIVLLLRVIIIENLEHSTLKEINFSVEKPAYPHKCFDLKLQKHVERYYVFIPLIGNIGLIDRDVLN